MADYLASVTITAEYWVTAETQSAAIELVQGYASVAGEGTNLIVSDLTDVEITDISGCADCQRLHDKCDECDQYNEGGY
jgi:hypothetical protein